MKLKTFLLSLSALLMVFGKAEACGGGDYYEGAMGNLFFMTNRLNADETGVDVERESVEFWYTYLGGSVAKKDLEEAIRWGKLEDFENPDVTENVLVKALAKHKDRLALAYLRLNHKLYALKSWGSTWDYEKPDPSQYEELLKELSRYTPTSKLKDRYTYLRMRILFALDRYDDVLGIWDNFASKWADGPLKRRALGYVAGAYYHKDRYAEALEVFDAMGDQRSINRCVSRLLDPDKLEVFYEKKPNSVVLLYVMQDYANYLYHAKQNDGDWGEIWPQVRRDYDKMMAFAKRVLKEKKVENLMPWQAFVGFLQYANNDSEAAFLSFCEAQRMGGTQDQQKLVRYLKMLASFEAKSRPADFVDYILGETRALKETASYESQNDVLSPLWSIYNYDLPKKLYSYCKQIGNKQAEFLVYALFDVVPVSNENYVFYNSYIDSELSADELVDRLENLEKPNKKDALVMGFTAMVSKGESVRLNELIGTKYMREGKYDKAIGYLKQTSDDFLKEQLIAPYLNLRKMPENPFGRDDTKDLYGEEVKEYKNVKLDFCIRMRDNLKKLKGLKGDAYSELAYEMACELFQASPAGDLWAMSEYYWSGSGSHYNGMSEQAKDLLQKAIEKAGDFSIKRKCYIGLASIHSGLESKIYYNWQTEKTIVNFDETEAIAYEWLKNNLPNDDSFRNGCDIFRTYVLKVEND